MSRPQASKPLSYRDISTEVTTVVQGKTVTRKSRKRHLEISDVTILLLTASALATMGLMARDEIVAVLTRVVALLT